MYQCNRCGERFEAREKYGGHIRTHSTDDKDYTDKETLERLYHGEGLDQSEIAERFDCSISTISNWMSKHDITVRDNSKRQRVYDDLWDKEFLQREYKEKGRTMYDLADEFDCSRATIQRVLSHYDIESHSQGIATKKQHAYFGSNRGYERSIAHHFGTKDQKSDTVRIHRLIAVAEYGYSAVKDKVVHHKNHIPWDNRPENLELMDNDEHMSYHATLYHSDEVPSE